MRAFTSAIANLRCPRCGTVQSLFAARTSVVPRDGGPAREPCLDCRACGTRLKLVSRIGRRGMYGAYAGFAALGLLGILLVPGLWFRLAWVVALAAIAWPLFVRFVVFLEET